jgi:hypothetical protein
VTLLYRPILDRLGVHGRGGFCGIERTVEADIVADRDLGQKRRAAIAANDAGRRVCDDVPEHSVRAP